MSERLGEVVVSLLEGGVGSAGRHGVHLGGDTNSTVYILSKHSAIQHSVKMSSPDVLLQLEIGEVKGSLVACRYYICKPQKFKPLIPSSKCSSSQNMAHQHLAAPRNSKVLTVQNICSDVHGTEHESAAS